MTATYTKIVSNLNDDLDDELDISKLVRQTSSFLATEDSEDVVWKMREELLASLKDPVKRPGPVATTSESSGASSRNTKWSLSGSETLAVNMAPGGKNLLAAVKADTATQEDHVCLRRQNLQYEKLVRKNSMSDRRSPADALSNFIKDFQPFQFGKRRPAA